MYHNCLKWAIPDDASGKVCAVCGAPVVTSGRIVRTALTGASAPRYAVSGRAPVRPF